MVSSQQRCRKSENKNQNNKNQYNELALLIVSAIKQRILFFWFMKFSFSVLLQSLKWKWIIRSAKLLRYIKFDVKSYQVFVISILVSWHLTRKLQDQLEIFIRKLMQFLWNWNRKFEWESLRGRYLPYSGYRI